MRDIDYFTEANMNKQIFNFLKSLPSELKPRVEVKLDGPDRIVLQGYRGPSDFRNGGSGDSETLRSESGVQEIRVQYNASKHVNWIPLAGTVFYGIAKLVSHADGLSDWKSLYFDEADGSYLTYDEAIGRRHKNRNTKLALTLHQEGIKLLDKGWNAEDNNDFENAETSFQTARDKFKEAKSLDPNNTLHQDYERISVLKIKGDQLFNQGVEFQHQANELGQQHFEKAIGKYKEALLKYQQGFETSGRDERFKSCIDIVKKSIEVATQTTKILQSSSEDAINEDTEDNTDDRVEKLSF